MVSWCVYAFTDAAAMAEPLACAPRAISDRQAVLDLTHVSQFQPGRTAVNCDLAKRRQVHVEVSEVHQEISRRHLRQDCEQLRTRLTGATGSARAQSPRTGIFIRGGAILRRRCGCRGEL